MRKRKWKVLVALTLCLALVGGTFYFAGGKDALKTKADSYGEEKGAPKDRQGILSLITNLIGGGSNSSNSISDTDGSGSDSASEQLNKNGLGSLSGLLGNGAISKILDLVSGGKIGMIKNLINTAMGLFNSNKSVSANQNCVVRDVR